MEDGSRLALRLTYQNIYTGPWRMARLGTGETREGVH